MRGRKKERWEGEGRKKILYGAAGNVACINNYQEGAAEKLEGGGGIT